MAPEHLVLFDIDGTLLWPNGAGRAAMRAALQHVYGVTGPIDTYYFAGRTDREIVRDLLAAAGLDEATIWLHFERLMDEMARELQQRIAEGLHHIRPCPGGPELVKALAACDDILLGLLTGNLRPAARIKLEAAGYDPALFRLGAYGDEATRRADLPPLAIERAARLTGVRFHGQQVVIIGDTPADITCGREVGARSIAVLTGEHPRAELEALGPHFLFDDLTDTAALLAAIRQPQR